MCVPACLQFRQEYRRVSLCVATSFDATNNKQEAAAAAALVRLLLICRGEETGVIQFLEQKKRLPPLYIAERSMLMMMMRFPSYSTGLAPQCAVANVPPPPPPPPLASSERERDRKRAGRARFMFVSLYPSPQPKREDEKKNYNRPHQLSSLLLLLQHFLSLFVK